MCVCVLCFVVEAALAMSDRRLSINDVRLPPDLIKGYTPEALKELNNQDDGSFFEFFQGLDLEDVSGLSSALSFDFFSPRSYECRQGML